LLGTGYGQGHPTFIPAVATDYPFAAWSEEFGAAGGIVLVAAFLVVVLRALRVALAQPDLYAKLLASGLAATLGFQVFIIVGGVLGLLPLTGITLPFFSYGGSSLVANFLLIALVWAIGSERTVQRAKIKTPV
jgi:cell division protein FtsW (lipid II flippase)